MDKPDKENHDLVPSSKKELINTSLLVCRGLDLAKNITDLSKYKASILWVDDEPDILLFGKKFLEKRGYQVKTFENGLHALDEIKKNNYDLLLTNLPMSERFIRAKISLMEDNYTINDDDWLIIWQKLKKARLSPNFSMTEFLFENFPVSEIGGTEFLRKVKEVIPQSKTILVLSLEKSEEIAKELGCMNYLRLPLQPDELLAIIEKALGARNVGLDSVKMKDAVAPHKASLMVVDDDPDMLDVLELTLSDQYKTVKFQNGFDALEEFGKNNYDMLITDTRMLGINGIELVTRAKALKPELLAIILNGSWNRISVEALALGCVACIEKPIAPDYILAIIEKVLSAKTKGLDLAKKNATVVPYKANLLAVDDDPDMLDILELTLSDQYKIVKFQNGFDALKELERNNYDILITDTMLLGINGIELVTRAKAFKPELFAIILWGSSNRISAEVLALGCVACIELPFAPDHLLETIEKMLIKKKHAHQ